MSGEEPRSRPLAPFAYRFLVSPGIAPTSPQGEHFSCTRCWHFSFNVTASSWPRVDWFQSRRHLLKMLLVRHQALRPWFALAFLAFALQSVVAGAFRCEVARFDAQASQYHATLHVQHGDSHAAGHSESDSGHQGHHGLICVCADGCHLSLPPVPRAGQILIATHLPAEPRAAIVTRSPVLAAVVIPYLLPPALAPPRIS